MTRTFAGGMFVLLLAPAIQMRGQEFLFAHPAVLTNREVALRLASSNGLKYRIDVSADLPAWSPLVTLPATSSSLQHTDSAAPFVTTRFYRAEQLSGSSNVLTGDHLATDDGDVVFHPKGHATFVMQWNDKWIYNDPTNGAAPYAGLPKPDLILVSHSHGDHYSASTITQVRGSNTVIVVPADIYNRSDFAALRSNAVALAYNASTNVAGITVQAVPGYNGNHALGINNCYVLTIGGKRIFISGDTGDVPEIRALTNIDVAFLCMNLPFTMNAASATNVIRNMRPRVVYPYHYRNQDGTLTNAATFKQWLGTDLGIEVRLRRWYP